MQLVNVAVSGFRSLENVPSLRVASPTLLSGHNDAGKSALLAAIRFLLGDLTLSERDRTYCSSASDAGGPPERNEDGSVRRVDTTAVTGTFELSFDEIAELGVASPTQMRRISRTGTAAVYERLSDVPSDERLRGFDSDKVSELKARTDALELPVASARKDDLLNALRQAAASATERTQAWEPASAALVQALPSVLAFSLSDSNDAEGAIKTALGAKFKQLLAEPGRVTVLNDLEKGLYDALVDEATDLTAHIKEHLPGLGVVSVVPELNFSNSLKTTQISIDAQGGGENVRLSEAGAGRGRQVALAVWEHTQGLLSGGADTVLLYDEPDTHLDYGNQRRLMDVLRKQCALANVRMVVATHSMNLIDGIDIANVVHVRHHQHRTVLGVLADDSATGRHLGRIAASLGLRNTVLLHERLFVGVEGASEQAALPVLFRVATGIHLESAGIALWNCGNHEGALNFAEFLVKHGRQVAFVVDADTRRIPRTPFSDDKLRIKGIDPTTRLYLGDPNELEDLFSDEQWATVANAEWPRNDGTTWAPVHFAALRTQSKFSKELLETLRVASDSGPTGKDELVVTLALGLNAAAQVPRPLLDVFAKLVQRATALEPQPLAAATTLPT